MRKKTVKLLLIILIVMQVFCMPLSVLANDEPVIGESVLLYSVKTLDNIKMNYYGQDIVAYYTVYNKDGVEYPAYCVDYFHGGVTNVNSYEVKITESYVDENSNNINNNKLGVWRAIINGYPFKSYQELNCADEFEAYVATKQAVFCMLYNREFKWYTYEGEAGQRVYNAMIKIVESAKNSNKLPQNSTINLNETEWNIDEINNTYLSKKITLNSQEKISEFSVNLEGNIPMGTIVTDLKNNELKIFKNSKEFKILVPLKNLVTNGEFTINIQGKVDVYPMYFGQAPSSQMQSYVLTAGVAKQEKIKEIVEYPENNTKLIIIKKDNEGRKLSGVKFNLLDVNKNIVMENVETNEEGMVIINNVIPGTYYLQEIETLEGYELNKDLIQIIVELNEQKEITVENTKTPEIPTIPEVPNPPEKVKLPRTGY